MTPLAAAGCVRLAVVFVSVVLAGCAQPPTDVAPAAANATTDAARVANATLTVATATQPPVPPPLPDALRLDSSITLMVGGGAAPNDRLGLSAPAPPPGAFATLVLSWNATLPTAARLALRIHEPGVLDGEGRVTGSATLLAEVSGTSPVRHTLAAADAPGGFDVHVYTPQEDPMPLVAAQDFALVIEYAWA